MIKLEASHILGIASLFKGSELNMTDIPLYMKHNLKNTPHFPLPEGYQFRFFGQEGDAEAWAKIVTLTNEFSNEDKAMIRFNEEFLPYIAEAEKRMIFIVTDESQLVGTATAWFGKWNDEVIGRLHWIEIIPEFQGRKLGRPLITKAMELLGDYHSSAFLKTQQSSEAAIHLYDQLGWKPAILHKEEQNVWDEINLN